jgi:hypothetical protein
LQRSHERLRDRFDAHEDAEDSVTEQADED